MALNDRDMALNKAVDVYPGIANPTTASMHQGPLEANYVTDPTNPEAGAGAGPDFAGDRDVARNFKQTAGVVEGRPGIIESANLDPLKETSNKDDGWANATKSSSTGTSGDMTSGIANMASSYATSAADTAKAAYQAGKEVVSGGFGQ